MAMNPLVTDSLEQFQATSATSPALSSDLALPALQPGRSLRANRAPRPVANLREAARALACSYTISIASLSRPSPEDVSLNWICHQQPGAGVIRNTIFSLAHARVVTLMFADIVDHRLRADRRRSFHENSIDADFESEVLFM